MILGRDPASSRIAAALKVRAGKDLPAFLGDLLALSGVITSYSIHYTKLYDKVPKDPWGSAYLYISPGAHGEYDLYSYGPDGQPGGEGQNADIGNWDLE